ncbi:class I SAM-dependent methyltransferase [Streptomyces sp. NPDC093595]|uniref:class I SAM-dependent methyltransferase n=1 Tax=Streptomyces sp. NPDC093595 TaxID=3366045 RepID=UPI00380A5A5B
MSAHHHHHGHRSTGTDSGTDIDWNELLPLLERGAELQTPLYRRVTAWLGDLVPTAGVRRVLDVGSGPGVLSCLLAEAFPYAEVVAVDSGPELLQRARERAAALGLSRVTTRHAELPADTADLGPADVIWAAGSLHHLGDQRAALAALAGLLRPGGLLVLVEGGLQSRHLPQHTGVGRPGLEARIDAASADWFSGMRAALPGAKEEVDDWRTLLTGAGLTPSGTRSFLHDVPAPVTDAVRDYVVSHFTWQRQSLGERLAADDRAALDRLLDPEDPRSVHRRPDVFVLGARTVHTARRA